MPKFINNKQDFITYQTKCYKDISGIIKQLLKPQCSDSMLLLQKK